MSQLYIIIDIGIFHFDERAHVTWPLHLLDVIRKAKVACPRLVVKVAIVTSGG